MADVKISNLPASTTPLVGTEVVPIVQSGVTKKVSIDNLTAGKAVSALSMTATNLKTSPTAANLDISGTTIAAGGTDANVDININAKGSGIAYLNQRWGVNQSGALVASSGNTYDIGNGTNNPRDVNVDRNVVIKGSSTGTTAIASLNASANNYTADLPAANTKIPVASQTLTFSGPSAARTITLPDANISVARTDAAQSFTGDQTILGNLGVGKTSTSAQIFSWGDVSTTYDGSGGGADLGAQIGANTVLVSNSPTTTSTFSQIVFQPSWSSGPTYARIAGIKASAAASDLAFSTRDGITTKEGCRLDFNQYFLIGYTASNGAYKLQVNSQIFATSSTIATSDRNYKTNIKPLNNTLDIVMQLNPVTFNWKKHPVHNFDCDVPTVGFIAQEVQMVLSNTEYRDSIVKKNECVLEKAVENESGEVIKPAITEDFYGIAEGNLIALLTKALQELNQKFDSYVASHP